MTAWGALYGVVKRCRGCQTRAATIERLRAELEAQTRLNTDLTAATARMGRRITDLEARVKDGKAREAALTTMVISALWQRGEAAHQVRKLTAVTGGADVGGEAA